jgi:hypothetical protein
MSTTILETIQKAGVTIALEGDNLRLRSATRGAALPASLVDTVRTHKAELLAELREKKRAEESALFEIALEYAKQFAQDAFKLLGNFKLVHLPGLHETYCESLARVMKQLVPPIGRAAFDEVLSQIECDQERLAIQAADNPNQKEHLAERHL